MALRRLGLRLSEEHLGPPTTPPPPRTRIFPSSQYLLDVSEMLLCAHVALSGCFKTSPCVCRVHAACVNTALSALLSPQVSCVTGPEWAILRKAHCSLHSARSAAVKQATASSLPACGRVRRDSATAWGRPGPATAVRAGRSVRPHAVALSRRARPRAGRCLLDAYGGDPRTVHSPLRLRARRRNMSESDTRS